ncbi:hypothetical protein [Pedobacter caeni]|uniref:Uncharacterized protein n=1 Tax=Pedobacter caeni TaxID=288992 RepID=A0A1M4TSL1_9SPHI|nr:hypothetical protein [Pedobacter caeni]SHE47396.1 hypothetical protein SAMN04488522_101302 [Pedobacter caeni]
MENTASELQKQKNSNLSLVLILVNVSLVLIFINTGDIDEYDSSVNTAFAVWALTILLGIYAFSYHGKGYRIAKWIFAILVLLSIGYIGIFIYVTGLAHSFKN